MAEKANGKEEEEEDIKPQISNDEIEEILQEIYGLRGGSLKQLHGYDDLNYHYLPEVTNNPFIKRLWLHGYVLKVTNSLESKMPILCEAQNSIMMFLSENMISSPVPVRTTRGEFYVKAKLPRKGDMEKKQKEHVIRLLEFQPGTVLKEVPKSFSLFHRLGIFVGQLNQILKKFHHPFYKTHNSIWHLSSVSELKSMTNIVENSRRRELAEEVIKEFEEKVLSQSESFERGMIHGDFNEHNVLMSKSENGEWEVSAILDFGDSHESCYLFELAVSLCYMMFECKRDHLDPLTGAGHFIAGYLNVRTNFLLDCGLLKICICARICQSLVLGLRAFNLHPENSYVLDSQKMGWPLLEELWEVSQKSLTEKWEAVLRSYNNKLTIK